MPSNGSEFTADFNVSFTEEQQRKGTIEYNYERGGHSIPPMRAGWTFYGACTSDSTAHPWAATRGAVSGGAGMMSTTDAEGPLGGLPGWCVLRGEGDRYRPGGMAGKLVGRMEYRVELDVYNGPMDLLLYLIKRDELDVYDIPISRITQSYLGYVKMLQGMSAEDGLDINVAGEFVVMAATLMEIKSAMLLPRITEVADASAPSTAEDLTDPRFELVQKLLEYKRFKDSAMMLEHKAMVHSQRFPRYPARVDQSTPSDEPPPLDMEEVQIWDLLDAFNRLMLEVGLRKTFHEVIYDDTPIDLHAADIEDRLSREGKLSLRQLIIERKSKSEMIGVFLALLELTRLKKILVNQTEAGDDIEIVLAPEEHRKTYQEIMSADGEPSAEEGKTEEAPSDAAASDDGSPSDESADVEAEPAESILNDVGVGEPEE